MNNECNYEYASSGWTKNDWDRMSPRIVNIAIIVSAKRLDYSLGIYFFLKAKFNYTY